MLVLSLRYRAPSSSTHASLGRRCHSYDYCGICNAGRKKNVWGWIPSFLLTPKPGGPDCSPEYTHLQTVQPVPHVGEALSGGDVIHEHHPLGLTKQLSGEAVVPAQRVCMRPPHPELGDSPITLGVDLMCLGSLRSSPMFGNICNEALSSLGSLLYA